MSEYKGCPEYKACRELWEGLAELNPRAYIEFKCDDCNIYRGYCDGYLQGAEDALHEERPQGEWVRLSSRLYKCKNCGFITDFKYPFCHCGADMRKGSEGND